jgi:hypothetical protein
MPFWQRHGIAFALVPLFILRCSLFSINATFFYEKVVIKVKAGVAAILNFFSAPMPPDHQDTAPVAPIGGACAS